MTIHAHVSSPDKEITVGDGAPLLLIGGPCALESKDLAVTVARKMVEITRRLEIPYVFKASFDKANRTSIRSWRGPGLTAGLKILGEIRDELRVPIISDIHDPSQAEPAAEVLDIIQIPAFLCRQTDLLAAAAATGRTVNVKKGQFVSPWDMVNVVGKLRESGAENIMLVERGASFGYNNLVVDMRSLPVLRSLGVPVVFDATHSVQLPGGSGSSSGGQREFIAPLAKAAVAIGVDALFMEIHPEPDKALCDGPNSLPLDEVEALLVKLLAIRRAVQ